MHWVWDITTAAATVMITLFGVAAAGHALITKREPKGAFGWIVVCLVFPFIGPFIYYVFGINRVQRRAKKLYYGLTIAVTKSLFMEGDRLQVPDEPPPYPGDFVPLARISDRIARRPVTPNNDIALLHNGEEAYPAMLRAIDEARSSVYLATYIYDVDKTGVRFAESLSRAHRRGVQVRILIDGLGEMHWGRLASRYLRRRDLCVARFIPPTLWPPTLSLNLRNHRKILAIDGKIAFTGGMNISDRHLTGEKGPPDRKTRDIHFLIHGPVARQIEQVFQDDWLFVTGEKLSQPASPAKRPGTRYCRVISDGPDEQMGKLYMILAGVISSARKRIRIMTPYFLPPRGILTALQTARVKGVTVEIILPQKNDIRFVHWATRNMLWELLEYDAKIYYQPAPFAHTKMILVDDRYVQVGSANIDSRSLRLNFEMNVEIFGYEQAAMLNAYFDELKGRCRPVTMHELDDRPLAYRLRDAFAWLFSSYL